jgi:hypothetical protein
MKALHSLTLLAATACAPLALATQPTVFSFSGEIAIVVGSERAFYKADPFSGTLDINTATGAFVSGSVNFGSPYPGLTVPTLNVTGYETAPGGPGTHDFIIALCTDTNCVSNWAMNMTLQVPASDGTLVGYGGGKIVGAGLYYGSIADDWGGCPLDSVTGCGSVTTHSSGGGGTKPGVPEPDSAWLLLLGLAATQLRWRRLLH